MCEFCENNVDMGNKPIEDRYAIDLLIDGEFIYAWCDCGRKIVKENLWIWKSKSKRRTEARS